ncbi:MAG TPA: hypothetical protein H9710_08355 [Candidatus Acutalibacter pullicola]|uniref:Uncharacterized protein n=1 Tax=Candidatus Acutalibacter pullicola TaxID=2838417 RepID=A0A9D2MVU5_9FIRM|nr:hypothetical protein [Candidatus Acutalibacter pullicola]
MIKFKLFQQNIFILLQNFFLFYQRRTLPVFQFSRTKRKGGRCMAQQPSALLAKKNIARFQAQPHQKESGRCMTQQHPLF